MSKETQVLVPDIGDFFDIPVVEINVSPGDVINIGDILIVLESDKTTLDVPSPVAGQISALHVVAGDLVSQGTLIVSLVDADQPATTGSEKHAASVDTLPPSIQPSSPPAQLVPEHNGVIEKDVEQSTGTNQSAPANSNPGSEIYASPSIRRYARQLGVPILKVSGTGQKNRILREDIEAFVKRQMSTDLPINTSLPPGLIALPKWPIVDFARFGPTERIPVSRIGKLSGPALTRNAILIPHVTNFDKCDITDLEDFRKMVNIERGADGAKITLLAFVAKACVHALQQFPNFNASLDENEIVLKQYWNIGIAVDTPEGLVVPVVKNVDKMRIGDIALKMTALAAAARAGRLEPADMQGATFTISSIGGIGGTNFTPIINAPEVAILGLARSEIQPVWDGEIFQPRLIQPLSLSWDHRVVDGVAAAKFLKHIGLVLADFRRAMI